MSPWFGLGLACSAASPSIAFIVGCVYMWTNDLDEWGCLLSPVFLVVFCLGEDFLVDLVAGDGRVVVFRQ